MAKVMDLIENTFNLVQNTTATLFAVPAPIEALTELPPPVVDDFWKLAAEAIKVVERAREHELLTGQGEAKNLDRLSELLTRALRLYRDALERAAISEETLRQQLAGTEPHLQQFLLQNYFRQVRGLAARITEYGQAALDAYKSHPAFVLDINLLLDAVERFTGYIRNGAVLRPEAGNMDTLYLLRAIAGEAHTWYDRRSPYSEFNMLSSPVSSTGDKWKDKGRDSRETQKYFSWVWSGASDGDVESLRRWQKREWGRELNRKLKRAPESYRIPKIEEDDEKGEIWFYINGVVTDHWIAQLNAEHIARIFRRPVHILHNPTEGLHRDLRECVAGRVLHDKTGVAEELREELSKLAGGKGSVRIVVVAHSQGTILMSEIVQELRRRKSPLLKRMEVFNFAFCADEFPADCCRKVEHYANENDFVAALSLTPGNAYDAPIPVFRRRDQWGHFLGAHYLDPKGFPKGAYRDETGKHHPVLSNYIGGGNYGV